MNGQKQYEVAGWSYTIKDNGYEIFGPEGVYITQFNEYGKVYKQDGTFEENCLLQLKELTTIPEQTEEEKE